MDAKQKAIAVEIGKAIAVTWVNGARYREALAELLVTYPWLQNGAFPAGRSEEDRWLWSLCYRSHDLDEIRMHLPHVVERVRARDQQHGPKPSVLLKQVCARWTIHARYSSRSASIREASEFLDTIQEIKKCLH